MRSITIPASIEHIDLAFFQLFPNAASIEVAPDNAAYSSNNGLLLDAAATNLLLVPEGMEGEAVLPDTLATVPACALSRCTKLSAIAVVPAAGSTGDPALTALDGIIYTNDLSTLLAAPAGLGASVRIAPECTAIAPGAFWGNASLKTIVAPGAVQQIATGIGTAEAAAEAYAEGEGTSAAQAHEVAVAAFGDSIAESATVVTAERAAWEAAGFTSFADPAAPGDSAEADGFAFTLLDDGTLEVRWAGDGAAPDELTIPATGMLASVEYAVSAIAPDAFEGQEGIRALVVPEGVAAVGDGAFAECASLQTVQLAGSVTSLGASAFAGCTALATVDLGGGLRTIGDAAFEGAALTNVLLPATVQSIGARAFAANAALVQVVALGDIAQVDATVLTDCTGVDIYTPYRADAAYAWAPGVPATGNHLMPYGVQLAEEPLILNQDEQASLLDGGYLEAAGSIETGFSYDAAPISVDPSSALVSAKQTGKTTVTASLMLDDTPLASATRPVVVALAPHSETEEAEERDHDHEDGEEACDEVNVDSPDISYKDQLFEEGDYYTSGNFAYEEKVINRAVALEDMDAGISTMSLEVPAVDSYTKHTTTGSMGGTDKANSVSYDAATKTLTWEMSPTSWKTTTQCGGSVGCATEGHGWEFRKSRNKLNAVRKLVLINWDYKNPKMIFSKMGNLEEVEIQGNFLSNKSSTGATSGVASVESLFSDCPQLRVIPSNMTLPSTITNVNDMFSFTTYKIDATNTSWANLEGACQPVASSAGTRNYVLTTYAGADAKITTAINAANVYTSSSAVLYGAGRLVVSSYYTVTFDNQGGTGGHQTVGESSSASAKTYTIKVPAGSPVPELIGTPSYYVSGVGSWTFGGYVDNLNNAPKEYVGADGYPTFLASSISGAGTLREGRHKVTANMTLKAFWYRACSFYSNGGTFGVHQTGITTGSPEGSSTQAYERALLAKGYPINTSFNLSNAPSLPSKLNSDYQLGDGTAGSLRLHYYTMQTPPSNGDRPFRGYTTGTSTSSTNFRNTAFYDANCNPTSAVYNEPKNFYAMWGYYTLSIYSNVNVGMKVQGRYWTNASPYWKDMGVYQTGTAGTTPFVVEDVYAFRRNSADGNWFQTFNSDCKEGGFNSTGWFDSYRDTSWSSPGTYYTLEGIYWDAAYTQSAQSDILNKRYTLSGNKSIYLKWKDNTPNDTITWKANGGYLNGSTSTTEKSDTVRRGNQVTAPTIARANTSTTRYTFLGWYNGSTKVCDAGGKVTANGAATYTAKWKTEYLITWNTGLSGAYWGSSTSDTAAKQVWVEAGGTLAVPSLPKKTSTSDTRWTCLGWNTTPVTPATGPATYTAKWKTEYKTTWKLGSTEAYWADNKTKTDRDVWFESGKKPVQPATPKRDAVAQYTYTFSSWSGITSTVTGPAAYTAVWDSVVNKYTIVWDVNTNGGHWSYPWGATGNRTTASQPYGTVLNGPQERGSEPQKALYTFVGWSTDKDADPDDPSQYAKQISVVGANTYYAIFAPNDYTIKLMKNDGSDDVAHGPQLGTVSAKYDRDWTIGAGHVPNRRGYYFIGWDTDPSYAGASPAYPMAADENGMFHDTTFKGNLINEYTPLEATLYAVWVESSYTIVFHENWDDSEEASGEPPAALEPLYSANVTIPGQSTMKRRGWYFTGWNTRADGSGTDYKTGNVRQFVGHNDFSDAQVRGCTVDLYAQWEPNSYFVFFEANTNDEWSDQGFDTMLMPKWGDVVTIETEFSRPGYEFVGWSFERTVPSGEDGVPEVDFRVGDTFTNLTDQRNGVVRLYAQWKGAPYQIIFDANADDEHKAEPGEDGPMEPLDMFLGVARQLPKSTFTCPGFSFKGWNTAVDGSGEAYANGELVQDIPGIHDGKVVLYAQWSPVISMTSPINAHIEVYIDGMDVRVTAVRPGSPQDAIESHTRGRLFVEAMELEPNLDPDTGMARVFPVDGVPTVDSWEDFTLTFTALNADTGKSVTSSVDFGNAFGFIPGTRNNYFVPAYDTATGTPGQLAYKLNMTVPEDAPVRYSEEPVQVGTLVFTCSLAE